MKKKKINKKRVLILFLIIAIIIVSIIKLNKKSSKNEDTEIDEQAQTTEQVSNDNKANDNQNKEDENLVLEQKLQTGKKLSEDGLPVLMYHFFYDKSKDSGKDGNWIEISNFEEQMKYLAENDFYFPTSMEKRLREFHKHPECAVVSSDAYVYHSNDLKHPFKREAARFICRQESNQFELLLKEESHFCAGCHMIRMADFEKVNPKREIYPAKRGQNWQLLLPVYYKFKRYYLDEPLYAYVVYPNSMSSGDMTEEKEMNRWGEHEEIIRQTLCRIPLTENEIEKYDNEITIRYAKKRFFTAIDYRDKKMIKEQYMILKDCQENTDEIRALYLRNYYLILKLFYKIKEIFKR